MILREYSDQILNIFNYYTGAIMTNDKGIIEYYSNSRSDVNSMDSKDVVGRSIFEVYPSINKDNSTIASVLRTGIPILDQKQTIRNCKGEVFISLNSTLPIKSNNKIIGAVEIYAYNDYGLVQQDVTVEPPKLDSMDLFSLTDIISISGEMNVLKRKIEKISLSSSNVLIYGETGTGKELVAQAIHSNGNRKERKFISQNCASLPHNLLESLLFGTVKGSFTGAENRMGLFQAADGGTLFLDEINTMDMQVQAKVLKAIEEQKIIKVGGNQQIPVNVRIIAATNKNPRDCVAQGTLREDLYYRLRVVQINLPKLIDREGDIENLTDYFINLFNEKFGTRVKGVSEEVRDFFQNYSWPGNVRELKNTIEGALNFTEGDYISLEDIDWYHRDIQNKDGSLKEMICNFERHMIAEALKRAGSINQAAELLKITRQNLAAKIKKYNI